MSSLVIKRVAETSPALKVALALARREGVRLIRHPVFLGGAILSLAFFGLLTWNLAPVLHRDDTQAAGALLPLAAATLIVANLAASRSARDGTHELYLGLASDARTRTVGHLLSLAWAVAGSVVVLGIMFAYLLIAAPVGTPRAAELAQGPLSVALLGAIGVALARWKTHAAAAPIAVVLLAALQLFLIQPVIGLEADGTRSPWFGLWVPMSITSTVPPELVIRPATWHLVYLFALIGITATFALLRHGIRGGLLVLLGAAIVVAAIGGGAQLRPPSQQERLRLAALLKHPEEYQVCEERGGVTYCAYPAYAPWIDRWARPVEAVLEQVPRSARPTGVVIRQIFAPNFEGPVDVPPEVVDASYDRPNYLTTGYEWGRGAAAGEHELGFSLYFAEEAVGLPTRRRDISLTAKDIETLTSALPRKEIKRLGDRLAVGRHWYGCQSADQARATVALWLAGNATPGTERLFKDLAVAFPPDFNFDGGVIDYDSLLAPIYAADWIGPGYFGKVGFFDAEFTYAVKLLNQPQSDVGSTIRAHWAEFTNPSTKSELLVSLFGLERLPTPAEQVAELPDHALKSAHTIQGQDPTKEIPCH